MIMGDPGRCQFDKGSVNVQVLRGALNCSLPVEIYHNGAEDVGPISRTAFEVKNITTHPDIPPLSNMERQVVIVQDEDCKIVCRREGAAGSERDL